MKQRPAPTETGRLVVARRAGDSVMIGDQIEITLERVERDKVRLGITAPPSVKILRPELWERQR